MREVSRLKFDTMRKLAKYEEHKNTVESFGYSTNKYSRVTNWYNSRLDKGFTNGEMAMGLFNGSILVSEPWYMLSPVLKQPAPALVSMFWNPVYDDPEGIKVSIDEYNKTINDVENAKKELQAGLNDVNKRIESLG